MSDNTNGWTEQTIYTHFTALREGDEKLRLSEEKRVQDRFQAEEKLRFAEERRTQERFASQERALAIAQRNDEKWREQANEWRGAITDKDKTLVPKSEYLAAMATLQKNDSDVKSRLDQTQGTGAGREQFWKWIVAALGAWLVLRELFDKGVTP